MFSHLDASIWHDDRDPYHDTCDHVYKEFCSHENLPWTVAVDHWGERIGSNGQHPSDHGIVIRDDKVFYQG